MDPDFKNKYENFIDSVSSTNKINPDALCDYNIMSELNNMLINKNTELGSIEWKEDQNIKADNKNIIMSRVKNTEDEIKDILEKQRIQEINKLEQMNRSNYNNNVKIVNNGGFEITKIKPKFSLNEYINKKNNLNNKNDKEKKNENENENNKNDYFNEKIIDDPEINNEIEIMKKNQEEIINHKQKVSQHYNNLLANMSSNNKNIDNFGFIVENNNFDNKTDGSENTKKRNIREFNKFEQEHIAKQLELNNKNKIISYKNILKNDNDTHNDSNEKDDTNNNINSNKNKNLNKIVSKNNTHQINFKNIDNVYDALKNVCNYMEEYIINKNIYQVNKNGKMIIMCDINEIKNNLINNGFELGEIFSIGFICNSNNVINIESKILSRFLKNNSNINKWIDINLNQQKLTERMLNKDNKLLEACIKNLGNLNKLTKSVGKYHYRVFKMELVHNNPYTPLTLFFYCQYKQNNQIKK